MNNASTIINNSLNIIKKCAFQGFASAHDHVKSALEQLYPVCCDDATYYEMCKVFLTMAYDVCENEKMDFTISRYRSTITVEYKSSPMRKEVIRFEYGYVFSRPRESWDHHFMRSAHQAASRTNCAGGRSVGAQFARNKVPLMRGYNGVPASYPHPKKCRRIELGCKTGEGLNLCPCNHAEINAIGMAAREGVSLAGSTLYVTSRPCPQCMGALTIVQPARIVFDDPYDGADETSEIAHHANIELIRLVDIT